MLTQHSKKNPNWGTPPHVVDWARQIMGGIDLDPCSSEFSNQTVQAQRIYTEAGEKQPWTGRIFVNPPGGQIKPFWAKSVQAALEGNPVFWLGFSISQLAYITPPDLGLFFILRRRIAFLDDNGVAQKRPSHYNYIWVGGRSGDEEDATARLEDSARYVLGPHSNQVF